MNIWPKLSGALCERYNLDPSYRVVELGLSVSCFDDAASDFYEADEDSDNYSDPVGHEEAVEHTRQFVTERTAPDGYAFATLSADGRPDLLVMVGRDEVKADQ